MANLDPLSREELDAAIIALNDNSNTTTINALRGVNQQLVAKMMPFFERVNVLSEGFNSVNSSLSRVSSPSGGPSMIEFTDLRESFSRGITSCESRVATLESKETVINQHTASITDLISRVETLENSVANLLHIDYVPSAVDPLVKGIDDRLVVLEKAVTDLKASAAGGGSPTVEVKRLVYTADGTNSFEYVVNHPLFSDKLIILKNLTDPGAQGVSKTPAIMKSSLGLDALGKILIGDAKDTYTIPPVKLIREKFLLYYNQIKTLITPMTSEELTSWFYFGEGRLSSRMVSSDLTESFLEGARFYFKIPEQFVLTEVVLYVFYSCTKGW